MVVFKTYIIFNELPTIKHLSHKNHVLYQDVKCPSCGVIDEDQQHLWLCQSRSHTINNIKQKFITTLVEQSAIINEQQQIDADKIEIIINSYGFINIIQKLIPISIGNYIASILNSQQRYNIIEKAITTLYELLYDNIWIPCCNKMNELEQRLGITKEMKMKYNVLRSNTNYRHNISHST